MPTTVRHEPELRSIGLHEERKQHSLLNSRPAPSPSISKHSHLYTPPPESSYTLPPPPTITYNQDTTFEQKGQNGLSRKSSLSSESGSRRNSRAMGSIAGKNTLINPKLSSQKLVDFASKITCMFWFESAFVLHRVSCEELQSTTCEPLSTHSRPTDTFKAWMSTMIATTQISQNVVFMALLFIYRLKMLNPTVQGRPGSECRLFTVAVMLGNKFLDDNTYTNKTWADVSRIDVAEIHVMEVEFLSNMKYNLFTSSEQWAEWETKLNKFFKYWDMASNLVERQRQPFLSRNTLSGIQTHLPSPPLTEILSSPSIRSPHSIYGSTPVSPLSSRLPPPPPVSICYQRLEQVPSRTVTDVHASAGRSHCKKRSFDGEEEVAPQQRKRVALGPMQQAPIRIPPPQQQTYYQPYGENYSSVPMPPLQLEPPVPTSFIQLPQPQLFAPSSTVLTSIFPSNASMYPSYPTSYTRSNSFSSGASTRGSHNIQIASFGPTVASASYTTVPSAQISPATVTSYKSQPSQRYEQTIARTQTEPQATLQPYSTYPNALGNIDRTSPYRPICGVNTLISNLPVPPSPTPYQYSDMQFYPPTKLRSTNLRSGSAYYQEHPHYMTGYSHQPLQAN